MSFPRCLQYAAALAAISMTLALDSNVMDNNASTLEQASSVVGEVTSNNSHGEPSTVTLSSAVNPSLIEINDLLVVTTSVGKIRGSFQKYRSGESGGYYSFKGIRYGQAPVGDKRFRAAEPENSWSGIRDASKEGNKCPQKSPVLNKFVGNEDCLFLNVFTNKLPKGEESPEFPVMVWVHGGRFIFGSGNAFSYGPDYLVAENIVLVTLNYRLGPLGFLTAGPDAAGNQGLKDLVLALKWVRDNIAAFGGDPQLVTIFGESAGSALVNMLLLSPLTKGLFHRAISESGSAFNTWAIDKNFMTATTKLAEKTGYQGTNTTEDTLAFLRDISAKKLSDAAFDMLSDIDKNGQAFSPTIEGYWNENGENITYYEAPFITETPNDLYGKHEFSKNIPYMMGYNSHEGIMFIKIAQMKPHLFQIFDNNFELFVPRDLNIRDHKINASRNIRQFYLGTKPLGMESVDETIALLTDIMYVQGIIRTARYHAKYGDAPVYLYRFSFDGALATTKRQLHIKIPGVCHADELGYLFSSATSDPNLDPQSMEALVRNRMVRMWTNFAKFGNPTPSPTDDSLITTTWLPVNPNDVRNNLNYMDITTNLEMKVNPEPERQQFWDNMYERYIGDFM